MRSATGPRGERATLLRSLWRSVAAHRWFAYAAVAAACLSVAPAVAVPKVIGAVVDAIAAADKERVLWLAVLAGVLSLLAGLLQAARSVLSERWGVAVEATLRGLLFERLSHVELRFFDTHDRGELLSITMSDLRQIRLILAGVAVPAVHAALTFTAVAAIMFATAPVLTAAALAPLILLAVLRGRSSEKVGKAWQEERRLVGELARQANEAISGAALIKGFGREQAQLEGFGATAWLAAAKGQRALGLQARFAQTIAAIPNLGLVVVLLFGGILAVRTDAISDGDFVAFYAYFLLLTGPTQQFGSLIATGEALIASVRRVFGVLDGPVGATPCDGVAQSAPGPAAVAFDNVGVGYENEHPVLTGVTVDVVASSSLAIAGPTGAGKSALLELVNRLYEPAAGAVRVGGVDVSGLPLAALRAEVAAACGNDFLFGGTVGENIAYGRPAATRAQVEAAARVAHAHEFIEALPDGYETEVGERGGRLSGGQRDRIALARALLVDPRVLLLDNVTGSLDPHTEAGVLAAVRAHSNATTLIVGYRPAPLGGADRVMVVDQGAVKAIGRPSELERSGWYRHLVGLAGADPGAGGSDVVPALPDGPATPVDAAAEPRPTVPRPTVPRPTAPRNTPPPAHRVTGPTSRRLRALGGLLHPDRRVVAAAALVTLVATAATLSPPYLAGRAIDDVLRPNDLTGLALLCVAMAGVTVVGAVAAVGQSVLIARVAQRALARLRLRIMNHLQQAPLSFYERHPSGVLISRITTDVETLDQFLTAGLPLVLSTGLVLVGTLTLMFALDGQLALVPLATFPLIVLATVQLGRRMARAYVAAERESSALARYVHETVAGARTVRTFAQEDRHLGEFAAINQRAAQALTTTGTLTAAYIAFVEVVSSCALVAVIVIGGQQAIAGTMTAGIVVAFMTYVRAAIGPIPALAGLYSLYSQSVAGLDKILDLIDEPTAKAQHTVASAEDTPLGAVRLDGVGFAYQGEDWVVRNIDLDIPAGTTLAIVGSTGEGKSTLAKLLLRLYDPLEGRVLVDGHDVATHSEESWRRRVGYVPQEPFLFTGTVAHNIAFARPDASAVDVLAAAREVGALDALRALPHGLETEVGERGENLSAGQRQLVALARAQLADPRLLVLDEATSSVDVATEGVVQQALNRLRRGRTTLLIAHRLSTVRDADAIAVLQGGKIVEQGTHADLIGSKGAYWRFAAASQPAQR